MTTGVSPWLGRAKPPTSGVSPIREVNPKGKVAGPLRSLWPSRDHGRQSVAQTGEAANLGRQPDPGREPSCWPLRLPYALHFNESPSDLTSFWKSGRDRSESKEWSFW